MFRKRLLQFFIALLQCICQLCALYLIAAGDKYQFVKLIQA
jgi:hypothetical protein